MATVTVSKKRQALNLATALYQRYEEARKAEGFCDKEFIEALDSELRDFRDIAYRGFVEAVAKTVDRKSRQSGDPRQGELFEVTGTYALSEGQRVAKRYALMDQMQTALLIDDQNRDRVEKANDRKHKELESLAPYWGPGVTKQEAIAAFYEANPDLTPGASEEDDIEP